MKKSILLLILSVTLPMHAQSELLYAGTEGLEHIVLELREALGDVLQNNKVRNAALISGVLAGAALIIYRSRGAAKSHSPARERYAGLMERKAEVARSRKQEVADMRASLGIQRGVYAYPTDQMLTREQMQTRDINLGQLGGLVPQMLFANAAAGGDDEENIKISNSFAQGALIGSMASALLIVSAYGKPIKNGMLLEKLRSLFPSDLVSQEALDKLWFLGWPIKAVKVLMAFW